MATFIVIDKGYLIVIERCVGNTHVCDDRVHVFLVLLPGHPQHMLLCCLHLVGKPITRQTIIRKTTRFKNIVVHSYNHPVCIQPPRAFE